MATNLTDTGKAVRKGWASSHPRLRLIRVDSGEQTFQGIPEHKGAPVVGRRLNAGEFRRAGDADTSRHLAGDAHMFHIHDGIVDLDARVAAQKMISTLGLKRQMKSKGLQQ